MHMKSLFAGGRTCLFYQVEQLGKGMLKKSRLMKLWIQDKPLKSTSLKVVHVMLAFLLQKLSKSSQAKHYLQPLERLIKWWDETKVISKDC